MIFIVPTLVVTLPHPKEEEFSEIWILGPNHIMEGYPSAVVPGENYHVFLGVTNQMGALEYYLIKVKLGNSSEPFPDSIAGIPSNLSAVYEYRIILQNNATWETDFGFTFNNVSFQGSISKISTISINGVPLRINEIATADSADNKFYYELFFELWIYNSTISAFQFHNRSVGFWINLTRQ